MKSRHVEFFIIFIFAGSILLFTTYPARISPFAIEDDVVYLKITHPENAFLKTYGQENLYNSFSNFLFNARQGASRFYPLAMCFTWFSAKITSADPGKIQVFLFFLSFIAALLFYVLLRNSKISFLTSLLFTGLFITGRYDAIWYHKSGELIAVIFLFLTFILIDQYILTEKKIYMYGSILSLLLSTLNKESFPILLPLIGILVILQHSKDGNFKEVFLRIRSFQYFLLFLFSILALIIGYVVLKSVNPAPGSENYFFHDLTMLSGYYYTWIPIAAAGSVMVLKKEFKLPHYLLIAVCSGWILSQVLVYSGMEITPYSRYQVPAVLLPLFIAGLATEYFRNQKPAYYSMTIFLGIVLLINSKNNYSNASRYFARNTSYHQMLDPIVKNTNPEKDKILFLAAEGKTDKFAELSVASMSFAGMTMPPPGVIYSESKKDGRFFVHPEFELMNAVPPEKYFHNFRNSFSELVADTSIKWLVLCQPEENSSVDQSKISSCFKQKHTFPVPYFHSSSADMLKNIFTNEKAPLHFLTFVAWER